MSDGALAFFPSLRRGAGTFALLPPSTSAARSRLDVTVRLFPPGANVHETSRVLELHGPGEVTGLDARTVIRTWPAAGVGDAAPNDMAAVEFDQADLPWRYSPLDEAQVDVVGWKKEAVFSSGSGPSTTNNDDSSDRIHPWIVLIVLKPEEIASYAPPTETRPLPVVTVRGALPPLDQSWAWAHVQATGALTLTPEEVFQRFASAPHTLISRLICPRRLEPRTRYRAFVVPSFERGRLRGLGQDPDAPLIAAAVRAWPPKVASHELPVYFEWEFQTATAGSDFEALVRRLTPMPLPPAAGTRLVAATNVDAALPPVSAQALPIGGALKNPNAPPPAWDAAERAAFVPPLTTLLDGPSKLLLGTGAPALAPPIYGRWLAADDDVGDAQTPPWLDALNRDPRNRIAAGAGAAVVEKQEEKLLTAAWEQIDGLPAINEKLRFAQLARVLAWRVRQRSLGGLASIDALYAVTAPAFARVRNGTQTLAAQFQASRLGRGPLEAAFRRLARPRGPLGRRLTRINANALATIYSRLNAGQFLSLFALSQSSLLAMASAGSAAPVASAPARPDFAVVRTIGPGNPPPSPPVLAAGTSDSFDAAMFRSAMVKVLTSMRAPRPQLPAATVIPMLPVRNTILAQLDPAATVAASLASRLRFSPGFARATTDPLEPILAAPEFAQPMYEPLRDLSAEWILPSLGELPNNSVSLAAVNAPFVESFMAGLNHEFARSLLWRRYPTDQRGTFFRQFWDSSAYFGPRTAEELRDVRPIDAWGTNALGANGSRPPLPAGAEPLVLVIHGDLLQQFPTTIVYAARAQTVNGRKEPVQPPDELHPIFRGTLPGSFSFFGFELTAEDARGNAGNPDGWFFVLQEQPAEPRFGFDASGPVTVPLKWSDLTWTHIAPAAQPFIDLDHAAPDTASVQPEPGEPSAVWHTSAGTSSAQLAYVALRRPPRMAIHATQLLGETP